MVATPPSVASHAAARPVRRGLPERGVRRASGALLGLLCAALWLVGGCATYSERLADARRQANLGDYPDAIDEVNRVLGVGSVEELPGSWKGNRPIATLERAVLLQAQGEFALSARDLVAVEPELEMLDLSTDALGKIGEYVYSGSSKNFVASPTERLSLNGLNMLNFLAMSDLSGSAVEARRYTNFRDAINVSELETSGSFGAYLAGFTFEKLGEGDRALRYYEEALEGGGLTSLVEPVTRLAQSNPYRGPRIESLMAETGDSAAVSRTEKMPTEILTVVALGRVPYKMPKRIPIGAAVGIAGAALSGSEQFLERSLLKFIVYPELTPSSSRARRAVVTVDGSDAFVEPVSNLANDIRREYEEMKPSIVASAITRMASRAAAAEGFRAAGNQASPTFGLIAALLAEGSMVALDKPDTRSWTFLPARIEVARTPVSPGEHEVEVFIEELGLRKTAVVDVPKNGFAVVVVTVPQ